MAIFGDFLRPVFFSEPRAARFRPAAEGHTMCGSMADIQSATAEIRQGNKEEERRNHRAKI